MSKPPVVIAAGLFVLWGASAVVRSQTADPSSTLKLPLRLTAWAVNTSNVATGTSATIEISVTWWSTAKEREALIATFLDKGQDELLKALKKAPAVGRMRAPGVAGVSTSQMPPQRTPAGPTRRQSAAASAARESSQQMALGDDIRYAWHSPLEDGGHRIVLAFDRYITFAEATTQPRVSDYPFTFLEIHLPPGGGPGEGKLSVATKLSFNKAKNSVELENYSTEPVRLQNVTVQK